MEYNIPSDIVKDLNFGDAANKKIIAGVDKLADAVKSTLGASGKCVIYEDSLGKPVITKDGVTVAESVVLFDPVENLGATLIKEAAKLTVKEAGDGTTTATVLAQALLKLANDKKNEATVREIKEGIKSATEKVNRYLQKSTIEVQGDMLRSVASISCNNDSYLGDVVATAFEKVGVNGVVQMEESEEADTYIEIVDGVQFSSGIKSPYLMTDKERQKVELEAPYVLISSSPIPNTRKIQSVLEFTMKKNRPLLIISEVEPQVSQTLLMNKVKGNIKVNYVDCPGFGPMREDTIEDLAILTGAKVINEQLGDDMDMITPDMLGECVKAVTDNNSTVITVSSVDAEILAERVASIELKIKEETNGYLKKKQEQRLAMLSGSVGIIKVGGDSKVELKEKKDRVEDAIYATKAALKEGIVPGGGIALLNAASTITPKNVGEEVLVEAIKSPYVTILENAGLDIVLPQRKGRGLDVITGKDVNMVKAGIIDPVLVTKTALKNAVSVVSTILSADCVISNQRQV